MSVTAELAPIPGSHLWTGTYGIWTDEGTEGETDLGQGTHDELMDRLAAVADTHGAPHGR